MCTIPLLLLFMRRARLNPWARLPSQLSDQTSGINYARTITKKVRPQPLVPTKYQDMHVLTYILTVERRRRETINEGINEIAKLVPGCEKNKGSILQRASAYITELSEKLKAVQETWNREKLVANTAITEISTSNTKIKIEANRRGAVAKKWLERCRAAGVKCDDYDEDLDGLHDLHIEPGV